MERLFYGNNKNNNDPHHSELNGHENSSEQDTQIVNLSDNILSDGERSLLNKSLGYVTISLALKEMH